MMTNSPQPSLADRVDRAFDVTGHAIAMSAGGAGLGSLAGPPGAFVGAALGAIFGLVVPPRTQDRAGRPR